MATGQHHNREQLLLEADATCRVKTTVTFCSEVNLKVPQTETNSIMLEKLSIFCILLKPGLISNQIPINKT